MQYRFQQLASRCSQEQLLGGGGPRNGREGIIVWVAPAEECGQIVGATGFATPDTVLLSE